MTPRSAVPAIALTALLASPAALAQEPTVEETAGRVVVSNPYYQAVMSSDRGGFISRIALPDGTVIVGEHALYTDRGIYGDGITVSSAHETRPKVEVARGGDEVTVTAAGTLKAADGAAEPKRRLSYVVTYRFDGSPAIRADWSVTPDFSLTDVSGFFSYIMQVPGFAEWFAKTTDGVVFQPASGRNQRCFQSALEPLDAEDPWMGLLLGNGCIVALSDIGGEPELGNVFMHEGETNTTALFCAWFSGPALSDLREGEPWAGGLRLHIWPRGSRDSVALPGFLR